MHGFFLPEKRLLPLPLTDTCKNETNLENQRRSCGVNKHRTTRSAMPKRLANIGQTYFHDENITGGEKTSKKQGERIRGGFVDVFFQQTWLFVNALNHGPFPAYAVPAPARSFPRTRIDSAVRLSLLRDTSPGQPAQATHRGRRHQEDITQYLCWP